MDLYTQKDLNVRKTWFLITMFLVMLVGFGWVISYIYNAPEILYFAFFISMLMNGIAYWKSDKIALAMSRARPIDRVGNEYVYRMVENLCITAGLPMPRLYIIDSDQINAFATGRDPDHAAIAITAGAISKLQNEELEGVLAHELAHIGNRDILLSSVLVVLAGLISLVSDIVLRSGFRSNGDRDSKSSGAMALIAILAAILAPIAAMVIQLAVSRKREFLADASGALLTRFPDGLANALEKISADSSPMRQAHNATAHMFISAPFKGKSGTNWFARLFMTHPPIEERVSALRGMNINREK